MPEPPTDGSGALPFFVVGGVCLQAGFIGAAARYGAGETAPVLRDTASYLTDGQGLLGVGRTVDDRPASASPGAFCAQCGSSVFSHLGDEIEVSLGTLDEPSAYVGPDLAIYTCDKQDFHQIPHDMKAFERRPG